MQELYPLVGSYNPKSNGYYLNITKDCLQKKKIKRNLNEQYFLIFFFWSLPEATEMERQIFKTPKI